MHIYLNGESIGTQANTLAELLSEQGYDGIEFIATAVNGVFVAKTDRADTPLQANDDIDIVAPMQGG